MGYMKTIGRRSLAALLCICLAAALWLPLMVSAEEGADAQTETAPAETAPAETTPPEQTQGTGITQADLENAWKTLDQQAQAAGESVFAYDAALAPVMIGDERYRREDVLLAVNSCAEALPKWKNLQDKLAANDLQTRIYHCEAFSPELRDQYAAYLWDALSSVQTSPLQILADTLTVFGQGLTNLEADLQVGNAPAQYLETLQYVDGMTDHLAEFLNAVVLLPPMESQLAHLSAYTDVQVRCKYMNKRYEQLLAISQQFFVQDLATQDGLAEDIRQLQVDLDVLFEDQMSDKAPSSIQLREAVQQQEQTAEQMRTDMEQQRQEWERKLEAQRKKLMFAYGALGMAVAALLMAAAAGVMALRKGEDTQQVDVEKLASSESLKRLQKQHLDLEKTQELQGQKLDELQAIRWELEELKKFRTVPTEMDDGKKPAEPEGNGETDSKPKQEGDDDTGEVKKPEPPVKKRDSETFTGMLKLKYSTHRPDNSELKLGNEGKYVLYDDDTMAIGEDLLGTDTTMKNWQDNGMLYLFTPRIGGRILTASETTSLDGTYILSGQVSRAKVSHSHSGVYKLREPGVADFEKMGN